MKRKKFVLSNTKLASMNPGFLVPIGLQEVLPGDSFRHSTNALIRLSPLVNPVMHPVHAKIVHWYVPNRILWDEWQDFITGGSDGNDSSVLPVISSGDGFAVGSLADYLGLPTGVAGLEVNALPFRAYAKIFNEFYRDQDLVDPVGLSTDSGSDTETNTDLLRPAWEKDYFTTARPWTQKGPEVVLPLGISAPVVSANYQSSGLAVAVPGSKNASFLPVGSAGNYKWGGPGDDNALYTDLSEATAATVPQLREAMALQRYGENRARYGSRYNEYLAQAFGVRIPDDRLQLPEYLGGATQTIQFSEIVQTAPTDNAPLGSLAGHGIGALRSNAYNKFFIEHGYVFSFMIVKPKTIYVQGLHRHWMRRIKEEFYTPELAHIGQQEVFTRELYASAPEDEVFGYIDRYDEYRRTPSTVAGNFRDTMDDWHFARIFASKPVLNADFVTCNPTNRPFAVQDDSLDQLQVMAYHKLIARRPIASSTSFIR